MTPQTFTNEPSTLGQWLLAVAFALGGVAAWSEFGGVPGVIVGSLGIPIVVAMRMLGTKMRIVCDEAGATVVRTSRGGERRQQFAWSEVSETAYAERTVDLGDGGQSTVGTFRVLTAAGVVLEVTTQMQDFDAIVACVNAHTRHLRYEWVRTAASEGRPLLAGGGLYSKLAVRIS